MKISLVIPFVDTWPITKRCLEKVEENTSPETEIILIDNGSERSYKTEASQILKQVRYVKNKINTGVLPTFKQGLEESSGDIICFIHSDVLLQQKAWDIMVKNAFEADPKIGLAGLFGAVGVGDNGGRVRSQSNMLGLEWGKCGCHEVAWQHHSEHLLGVAPATILDGVGMFFRRKALIDLVNSDMFEEWRALHHFYDRIMPLKLIDKGWRIATIGIGFDHASGQTANSSKNWNAVALKWALDNDKYIEGMNPDQMVYNAAEQQFMREFKHRLPCTVDSNYEYHWSGIQ